MSRVSHQIREVTMHNISTKRVILVTGVLVLAILPLSLVLAQAPPPPPPPASPAVVEPVPVVEPTPVGPNDMLVTPAAPLKAGAESLVPPPPPKRPHVRVGVQENRLTVNGAVVSTRVFPEVLHDTAAAAGKNPVVILDADGSVAMGRLHDVQDELRKAELTDIVYAGETGRKLTMSMLPADVRDRLKNLPDNLVMHVAVDGAGVLTVGGEQVPGRKLASETARAIDREPKLVVALHTSRETRYGAFVQVLGSLKQGGATRIAILDPEK